jgi:hypothetical protein
MPAAMVASNNASHPKFPLGQIVATPGALAALERSKEMPIQYLKRHAAGDWGTVGQEDRKANDRAVLDGSRILSAYRMSSGERLWIITEATDEDGHRSATTLLLPEEY